ncbi:DUF6503 family protein [Rufibacter tibetensis]|uniref:DUF6503 family protein n=1 Tax=Rufibacter tibetensis TaxID=512763 RepID=UPI00078090AB|nr:DUF6503 family protein [Rufibacter tibetensis]
MKETLNILLVAFVLLTGCQSAGNKMPQKSGKAPEHPSYFKNVLQAHGGFERWNKLGSMQFQLMSNGKTETQLIDLKNRKDLIKADNYTIGYDGKQVWVSPNKAAYPGNSAHFYHNLYFYFFAIPFVLADPGVNYRQLSDISLAGQNYSVIEASFGQGIGDSPEDKYRLLLDPTTNRLEWLLYTVTYFNGKPSDKFNALKYEDYQEHQGLLFPQKLTGYKYENGQIGEARYTVSFSNLQLKEKQPDQRLFEMPEKAEVDAAKK